MAEITSREQLEKVRGYEKGYFAIRLIGIGIELGLFEKIDAAGEGITPGELAKRLGLHEPYVKIWCQTAYAWELLDCDESGRFRLPPGLNEILVDKTKPRNYEANIRLTIRTGPRFDRYAELFKSGERLIMYAHVPDPDSFMQLLKVTANLYPIFINAVIPRVEGLGEKMEAGANFLDIGCGAGVLMVRLAEAYPNSRFVGVDPTKQGIQAAERYIKECGQEGKISVKCLGGESMDYNEEFDAATMVVTLHEIPPELKSKVLGKAYQALKKGGKLIIMDQAFPNKIEDFRNPLYEYGIIDEWYEVTFGNIHQSSAEIDHMLLGCGFKDIVLFPIGRGMFEVTVASK